MSISKPESSARHIKFVFFEKNLDFIREFSLNVFPVSSGLFNLKSEQENILIYFGSKSLISLSFPLLLVPINSLLIFFFNI